jgi:hypothetical protein
MPVVVKTPACPAVVCPPPAAAGGAWQAELSDDGCEARFHAASGHLLGFVVLEAATTRKQALAAQVPAWLAAPPAPAACVERRHAVESAAAASEPAQPANA